MMFEGFGWIISMQSCSQCMVTVADSWEKWSSNVENTSNNTKVISSHDYKRADDEKLAALAKRLEVRIDKIGPACRRDLSSEAVHSFQQSFEHTHSLTGAR